MRSVIKKNVRKLFNTTIPSILSKSKLGAVIYYTFFSPAFQRELQAALTGKVVYNKLANTSNANRYLLIRNTHRIEKGLLMIPRRDTFAVGYIEPTINALILYHSQENHLLPSERYRWFVDVLSEYFIATKKSKHNKITTAREKFSAFLNRIDSPTKQKEKLVPYKRNHLSQSEISFDAFYRLSRQRRSVRWFQDKKVEPKLIEKAVSIALQSPSACNRQPFEYYVIEESKLLRKAANIPMGTSGYADSIPLFIVCVGDLSAYFDERDRHLIYIDSSLANMSLMYALETLGLSSCPINWPDIEEREKEMEELLQLPKHKRPIMCMAIGYPDYERQVAYSAKESLENIIKYIK